MRFFLEDKHKEKDLPALFLDRDGVINIDYGHVYKIDDFKFNDGIFDLVKEANSNDFIVIIITNQAGIAKGYYTEDDFGNLSNWMIKKFLERNAHIDAIYYSPFHPTMGQGKYLQDEDTRKPGAGMIFEAMKDFRINTSKSILVGDKVSDIQAGIKANIQNNLLYKNHEENNDKSLLRVINKDIKKIESLSEVHSFFAK
tara:strand:- start:251 stop:847 length:597 start_codon:yes stop_codon:yes gene_type:complete